MKLYTFFRSSASFRVRIALNYKGLAYEPAIVSLPKA
jgi:maleylpyruvate isomerase